MKKSKKNKYGTHYEAIPHTSCHDPKNCDCECKACMEAYTKTRKKK